MQFPNRQKWAVVLMSISLLLLAAFLILFVQKAYRDETGNLSKEVGLIFVNSVQNVQGAMLDKIMVLQMDERKDSLPREFLRRHASADHDTMKIIAYFNSNKKTLQRDSNFKIQILEDQTLSLHSNLKGSLSVVTALGNQKTRNDSLCLPGMGRDTGQVQAELTRQFGKAMAGSGLPVQFQLVQMDKDSTGPGGRLLAGSYTDMITGQRFGALLSAYQGYVFRQILPQLLFASLLFLCVAIAFLFIYQTMRQQQRLAEQKNDFIRNVTHELKTPIATVSVAIEALQNFDALQNPERTREYLDISRLELSRLSLLVDKVLRMSLFEKGEPELKLERLDFKLLVEEILNSMKLQFEKFGARVGFNTTGADFSMDGDRMHLASVVYNLLDNALKYSPKHPEISVGLIQNNGNVRLEVRDNGIGIPLAYREKIFDKFFRVPSGNVHNVKGHGLGLSYVAGVVSKHRGTIEVDSKEGEGTCFTIAFQTDTPAT